MAGALVIRRTNDGTKIEGNPPEEHSFSARWIHQEIQNGLVEVVIRLKPDQGDAVEYSMTGFGPINEDDPENFNFTDWRGEHTDG